VVALEDLAEETVLVVIKKILFAEAKFGCRGKDFSREENGRTEN